MSQKQKQSDMADTARSIGEAYTWVARITSVCGAMVLPAIGGMWLDNKLGLTPILTLTGLLLGMVGGLTMLIQLTKVKTVGDVAKEIQEGLEDGTVDLSDQPRKPR
jgi:F0F1-type ATP synthase assembly protein I